MIKYYCDKCEKEVNRESFVYVRFQASFDHAGANLCRDCAKEVAEVANINTNKEMFHDRTDEFAKMSNEEYLEHFRKAANKENYGGKTVIKSTIDVGIPEQPDEPEQPNLFGENEPKKRTRETAWREEWKDVNITTSDDGCYRIRIANPVYDKMGNPSSITLKISDGFSPSKNTNIFTYFNAGGSRKVTPHKHWAEFKTLVKDSPFPEGDLVGNYIMKTANVGTPYIIAKPKEGA